MDLFVENFWWMIPNLALAGLGFVFALLYLNSKNYYLRILLFTLWFLFLPNTIYLVTDIEHFVAQVTQTDLLGAVLLTIQYSVLILFGIVTYFVGMQPMQTFFNKKSKKGKYDFVFIALNFAIGFAVVLGKVERTHSWYVFTQPNRVLQDVLSVLTDPILLGSVIIFGLFLNLVYFAFKNRLGDIK